MGNEKADTPITEPNKSKEDANGLKHDALLGFLGSEIDNLRHEEQTPGWTKWALTAAFAALLWLILNTIEQNHPTPHGTAVVFFMLTLLSHSLMGLRGLIASRRNGGALSTKRYMLFHRHVGVPPVSMVLLALEFSLPLVLAHSLERIGLCWYHKSILTVAYSLLLLVVLGGLAITLLRLPVSTDVVSAKYIFIIALAFCAAFLWPTIAVLVHMHSSGHLPGMADWRLGGLLFALLFVVAKYTRVQSDRLTIESLVHIRRSVALGHVQPDVASRQADIALLGMRLDDVMGEQVRQVVSRFMRAEEDVAKAHSVLETCATLVEKQEADKDTVLVLVDSASQVMERAREQRGDIETQIQTFANRLALTVGRDASSDVEAKALKSKVLNAVASLAERQEAVAKTWEALRPRVEAYSGPDDAAD